jgi:hypothetical protein
MVYDFFYYDGYTITLLYGFFNSLIYKYRNLCGSHTVVFITKENILIQSNITQVYFDSNCAIICELHISACT